MDKISEIKQWVIDQVLWAEKELKGKSGAEKKAVVVKKLDDLVKLPFYLECVDDMVIAWLVDQACEKLNAMTNKNFIGLILSEASKEKLAESIEGDFDVAVNEEF